MKALVLWLLACGAAAAEPALTPLPEAVRSSIGELRQRLTAGSGAGQRPRGCFQRHIEDALRINRERLPRYSEASGGATERISRRLIGLEKLSLWAARYFDWRSESYRAAGVPLLCDDFAPMSEAPPFATGTAPPPPRPAPALEPDEIGRELRDLVSGCERPACFEAVSRRADERLRAIEDQPDYYCMTRHILASVRRAADLAPGYDRAARARGLSSPYPVSRQFIWAQTLVVGRAFEMDQWAMPLQERGVPILCRDVPSIPR